MPLDKFRQLQNVGQFDNAVAGANLDLKKLSLIYAENGRGKTTLSAILRSLATNETRLISDRKRLGAANAPHIVINIRGNTAIFSGGAWNANHRDIEVFDDAFVASNVCSGLAIESHHKQNLHELILGANGVVLARAVDAQIQRIEDHNRNLRVRAAAITEDSVRNSRIST